MPFFCITHANHLVLVIAQLLALHKMQLPVDDDGRNDQFDGDEELEDDQATAEGDTAGA